MAFLELSVEHLTSSSALLQCDSHEFDSLSNVVDPNLDLAPIKKAAPEKDKDTNSKSVSESPEEPTTVKTDSSIHSSVSASLGSTPNQTGSLQENDTAHEPNNFYPRISSLVAEYVAQQNPNLCAEVAKRIEESKVHSPRRQKKEQLPQSPFKSMASTSDALALQQSPIGSSSSKNTSVKSKEHLVAGPPKVPSEAVFRTLIAYPPNTITRTVEQSSWLKAPPVPKPKQPYIQNGTGAKEKTLPSQPATSNGPRQESRRVSSEDVPSVHIWKKETNSDGALRSAFNTASWHYEPDLECDNLDSVSVCSETESNISWISDVDEELLNIKKMLNSNLPMPNRIMKSVLPEKVSVSLQTDFVCLAGDRVVEMKSQETETDCGDYFIVLREKANLEGQVEMLKEELSSALKEHSGLKSAVASLEAQSRKLAAEKEELQQQKTVMSQELRELKEHDRQYDNLIAEYQNLVESKDSEAKALKADMTKSDAEIESLKISVEELKVDLESKTGAVEGLKKKIAELHVETHTILQAKVQLENDNSSLRNELDTLVKSKEWFREQLHENQKARNKIHQELISSQSEKISLTNSFEALKVENARLKQELLDNQQRMIREKGVLMKHLENIQADMMERESLFLQIQKEKGNAEESMLERMKKVEEEHSQLNNLHFTISDLEHQLKSAKVDLDSKIDLITDMEIERSNLIKDVNRLQMTLSGSELSKQNILQQLQDLQAKMRQLQKEMKEKEEVANLLKSEKTALGVALASAEEDKKIVHESLKVLQDNLNRVENNFKMMRADLVSKTSQVEALQKDKMTLEASAKELKERLSRQQENHNAQTQVTSQKQDVLVDDLKKQKADLERVMGILKKEVSEAQKVSSDLLKEKNEINAKYIATEDRLEAVMCQVKSLNEKNGTLKSRLRSIQSEQNKVEEKKQKEEDTKRSIGAVGLDEQYLLNELDVYKRKVKEMEVNLATKEATYKEQQRMYKSNIKLLTKKLREKMKEHKALENDLKQFLIAHPEVAEEGEQCAPSEPEADIKKEEEARPAQEQPSDKGGRGDEPNLDREKEVLLIELEKERGRLSGYWQTQGDLKEYLLGLEEQLASKESSLVELTYRLNELKQRYEEEETQLSSELATLKQDLTKEKTVSKDLRHQIFEEKRTSSQLRHQVVSLKQGLEQANQMADSKRLELQTAQKELGEKQYSEMKVRTEVEELQTELKKNQRVIEELRTQLHESQERDPALAEQMKLLSWHVKEKSQEVAALKERLKLADTRHSSEMNGLQKSLQTTQKELATLTSELAEVRKEKFTLQAKVQELRNALKARVEQCKKYEKQLAEATQATEFALPESPAPYDDSYINALLQQSSVLPESRPLGNLQVCLDSLKQELNTLQKQLKQNLESSV